MNQRTALYQLATLSPSPPRRTAPRFAKRHYEAIATVMQWSHNADWQTICDNLADMLKTDNSDFQRDRFLRACKPGANVRARS